MKRKEEKKRRRKRKQIGGHEWMVEKFYFYEIIGKLFEINSEPRKVIFLYF